MNRSGSQWTVWCGEARVMVWALFSAVALIQACSTPSSGPDQAEVTVIVIEGIVIRNELSFPVKDVMINAPASGAFAGCGNILQRSECRTRFEAIHYAGDALIVSWKEYGQPHQTPEFVIDTAQGLDPARPAWLEVVIFAMGQAEAGLIQ